MDGGAIEPDGGATEAHGGAIEPAGGATEAHAAVSSLFFDGSHEQVVYVTHQAARRASTTPLPDTLAPELRAALVAQGAERLYSHQRSAYDLLAEGHHVIVATGTASGKSLCFAVPTLDAFAHDAASRALYLYPTKALAQDQARRLSSLRLRGAVAAIYDGDTPQSQRPGIRARATIVLSNPDMLHVGVLPAHDRWAEFLHNLRYVVLDEAHVYRGVFGSHVAQVLRRLRRLCRHYGADPRFILTSATIANPGPFAEKLVGLPFTEVTDDGSPQPEKAIVFWNPPLLDAALGQRASALAEASYVIAETVLRGLRVIGFAPTRKAAELIYTYTRRRLEDRDREAAKRVSPYRAGYTPQQRRDIERRLFEHELEAVVATSALELGIDVGSLDLSLVTGFPGTVTSLRQRWGRAGRQGHGFNVLVAGQDALDQYFMREPERLLSRSVEEAIIDLANPHILDPHLEAAAYEKPLTEADTEYFGEVGMARAAPSSGAGLTSPPPASRCAAPRARRSSSSRRARARCWAPSSASASSASPTPAPSTCTSARATSCANSTSRRTPCSSTTSTASTTRSPRPRSTCSSPASRSCVPSPLAWTSSSASSRSPNRWSPTRSAA